MKATLSKDGHMRITVRIPHRIDSEDIINALGWHLTRELDFQDNKAMQIETALTAFKNRKALLELTMKAIAHEGAALWTWSDDQGEEVIYQIREQSRVLVARKFPELRPAVPEPAPNLRAILKVVAEARTCK